MIYTALALIWVIYISNIISIISLTYRCVVEMIDEVTGFTDTGNGLVCFLLAPSYQDGEVLGGYAIFIFMAASLATQNRGKFIGAASP